MMLVKINSCRGFIVSLIFNNDETRKFIKKFGAFFVAKKLLFVDVKVFARWSLAFARCLLLFARCSLVFARCSLLVAAWSLVFACCSLRFAPCLLVFARCLLFFARFSFFFTCCWTRNSEEFAFCFYLTHEQFLFVLSKSKQKRSPY